MIAFARWNLYQKRDCSRFTFKVARRMVTSVECIVLFNEYCADRIIRALFFPLQQEMCIYIGNTVVEET